MRARLLAAIVLTVAGPVVTIGVALAAFGSLGERGRSRARFEASAERTEELLVLTVQDVMRLALERRGA